MFSLSMCIAVEKTDFSLRMHENGNFYLFQNTVGQFSSHIILAVIFITCSDGYSDFNFTLYTVHNYETVYHTVYLFFINKPF